MKVRSVCVENNWNHKYLPFIMTKQNCDSNRHIVDICWHYEMTLLVTYWQNCHQCVPKDFCNNFTMHVRNVLRMFLCLGVLKSNTKTGLHAFIYKHQILNMLPLSMSYVWNSCRQFTYNPFTNGTQLRKLINSHHAWPHVLTKRSRKQGRLNRFICSIATFRK